MRSCGVEDLPLHGIVVFMARTFLAPAGVFGHAKRDNPGPGDSASPIDPCCRGPALAALLLQGFSWLVCAVGSGIVVATTASWKNDTGNAENGIQKQWRREDRKQTHQEEEEDETRPCGCLLGQWHWQRWRTGLTSISHRQRR